MSWVLDPVPSDVKALDDIALRELVRRLCEAELKAMGLSPAGLIAGGHQKAKDGGIDVRVEGRMEGEGGRNGYLPALPLGFQVKATTMAKADIDAEMRFKGVLRPSIIALGQDGGAYIIACGQENLTGLGREERVRAMRLAYGGCETPEPHFDVYDASRLADWARQHRSVAIWLLEKAGRSTRGWSDLANWSAPDQGLEPVFLADDQARLRCPWFARFDVRWRARDRRTSRHLEGWGYRIKVLAHQRTRSQNDREAGPARVSNGSFLPGRTPG